ncbi:MAG TPA: putative toxin-antitoxin system toxin component, PIN family [Clostridiaceae bacterium]|nr:putative toxin-antitoxin system toxin component, PIN family [Clostridiaceae bacterium]
MRILIDTNILISALLFPHSKPAKALTYTISEHQLVLCDQNLFEFREVIGRKNPELLPAIEEFLHELCFERIPTKQKTIERIRDPKDQPILNAAMSAGVDIIVTGDKDFLSLQLKKPLCMTDDQFLRSMDK